MGARRNRRLRNVRLRLYEKQQGRCFYCNNPMKVFLETKDPTPNYATFDHKIPKSKGGKNTQDNIVLACWKCNRSKGAKDALTWRHTWLEHITVESS